MFWSLGSKEKVNLFLLIQKMFLFILLYNVYFKWVRLYHNLCLKVLLMYDNELHQFMVKSFPPCSYYCFHLPDGAAAGTIFNVFSWMRRCLDLNLISSRTLPFTLFTKVIRNQLLYSHRLTHGMFSCFGNIFVVCG